MSDKVVTTNQLEDLSNDAWKRGYNRRLDYAVLERSVDPDGLHILSAFLMHEHKAGKACEPHARCRVLIKVKDTTVPVEAWLDVELGRYNRLATVEQVQAAIAKAQEQEVSQ